ncbi:1818_t:CDS:2, partial [Scutellospora calospora]
DIDIPMVLFLGEFRVVGVVSQSSMIFGCIYMAWDFLDIEAL